MAVVAVRGLAGPNHMAGPAVHSTLWMVGYRATLVHQSGGGGGVTWLQIEMGGFLFARDPIRTKVWAGVAPQATI